MDKQIKFPQTDDIRLETDIKKIINSSFPLPEKVETARKEAFAKVRAIAADKERKQDGNDKNALAKNTKSRKNHQKMKKVFSRGFTGAVAAMAVFFGFCMVNPAVAAQIPIVNHVFERLGGVFSICRRLCESGRAGGKF